MGRRELTKQEFYSMAAILGLDPADPFMEELYPYVARLLRSLEPLDSLDFSAGVPTILFDDKGTER